MLVLDLRTSRHVQGRRQRHASLERVALYPHGHRRHRSRRPSRHRLLPRLVLLLTIGAVATSNVVKRDVGRRESSLVDAPLAKR